MKIFLLGPSGSGKSPLAKLLSEALGAQHIAASEWIRKKFRPSRPDLSKSEFVAEITAQSLAELKNNPHQSADFIRAKYDLSKLSVIEGIRNAFDLPLLFDPRSDYVVFLKHVSNPLKPTKFERGIRLMAQQVKLLCQLGLMDRCRALCYDVVSFHNTADHVSKAEQAKPRRRSGLDTKFVFSLEQARDDLLTRIKVPEPSGAAVLNAVHADVPRVKALVKAEYLYNMNPAYIGKYHHCEVFALSSYAGSTPTVKIILSEDGIAGDINTGSVFSYIPAHALVNPAKLRPDLPLLELADLVYHNAREGRITVNCFEALKGRLHAYFVRKDVWLGGDYVLTVDWYDGNDLLHLIALDNGQYAMLPSHKIKFGEDSVAGFSPFKKLKSEWKV